MPLLTRALAMRFLLIVLAAASGLACSTTYPRQLPCDIPHGSVVLCYRQAALHHECEHVSSLFSTGSHHSSYTHYHGVTRREHVEDGKLATAAATEAQTRADADTSITAALVTETDARKTEDGTPKKVDASEAQTRADADTSITAALVTETDARKTEDGTLKKVDTSEAQTRADADVLINAAL